MGSFEEKLIRKTHTTFLYGCCKCVNQIVRRIGEYNGQSFKGLSKQKNTHEEIEFHNSIQDWVFTTVYRL